MFRKLSLLLLSACAICSSAATKQTIQIATDLVPAPDVNVVVIVPDGYEPGKKFPTVYLLNGFSDNNNSWSTRTQPDLDKLADAYGMVMVMPDGRDSWYWDSPVKPEMKMESFIINELVPYIDAVYPTQAQADKRAITGLSMGGHGAMWLGLRHPDVFGNIGSTSGGVDIRPFPNNWKMKNWLGEYESNKKVWDEHSVLCLIPQVKPGSQNIIFDCGNDDFFAEVNNNLHKAMLDAGIPHDYITRPGGHTHPYWRNSILFQLLFFNEAFNRQ